MFTKWEDRFVRETFLSQNGPSSSLTKRSVPFSLTKRVHKTVPFSHKAVPNPRQPVQPTSRGPEEHRDAERRQHGVAEQKKF